ncbi:MAG: Uma2 family endonuclease [Cyanobacteria bacterium J06634_5]
MASLQVSQIEIGVGDRIRLQAVSWQQYKQILGDLADRRTTRVAYDNGKLEIMLPQPGYEDDKEIISDLVKVLLEEKNTEFRALGSTTFEHQATLKSIEPDQCFYIKNEGNYSGLILHERNGGVRPNDDSV